LGCVSNRDRIRLDNLEFGVLDVTDLIAQHLCEGRTVTIDLPQSRVTARFGAHGSNMDWNRTVPRSLSGLLCLYAFDIGLL
jgi:hypothetical protein